MNFCSACGKSLIQKIPENDNRLRYVCSVCHTIHYQNPNIVAGVLPLVIDTDGIEKVLLCRRAINPRYGLWTLPAGFMENGECVEEAAERESIEEANLTLGKLYLYAVMSLPHISQVYMMYIAQADNDFSPGEESLETRLFSESEIPWDELAFPVMGDTLQYYFKDRKRIMANSSAPVASKLSESQLLQFPVHSLDQKRLKDI